MQLDDLIARAIEHLLRGETTHARVYVELAKVVVWQQQVAEIRRLMDAVERAEGRSKNNISQAYFSFACLIRQAYIRNITTALWAPENEDETMISQADINIEIRFLKSALGAPLTANLEMYEGVGLAMQLSHIRARLAVIEAKPVGDDREERARHERRFRELGQHVAWLLEAQISLLANVNVDDLAETLAENRARLIELGALRTVGHADAATLGNL